MSENVKTLSYNGIQVHFIKMKGTWFVATKNFGHALGYNNAGRRLVTSVAGWKNKGVLTSIVNQDMLHNGDATILEDQLLKDFLALIPNLGIIPDSGTSVGGNASLSVLSLQGASKVLARANMKGAKDLRNRWEEVTTAIMDGKEMPVFSKAGPQQYEIKSTRLAKDATVDIDPLAKVKKSASLCKELVDMGALSLNDAKSVITKAMNNAVNEMWPEAIVVAPKAPLATTNDDVLAKSGGLSASMYLPEKWKGWKTAHDLAQMLGKTAESVGHYIPIIIEESYGEVEKRANKIAARDGVSLSLEKFAAALDNDTGLATVYNDDRSCIALYAQNVAGGGFNWRNYWSPPMAQWLYSQLVKRYEARSRGSQLPETAPAPSAMPAPIPFNQPALPKSPNGKS